MPIQSPPCWHSPYQQAARVQSREPRLRGQLSTRCWTRTTHWRRTARNRAWSSRAVTGCAAGVPWRDEYRLRSFEGMRLAGLVLGQQHCDSTIASAAVPTLLATVAPSHCAGHRMVWAFTAAVFSLTVPCRLPAAGEPDRVQEGIAGRPALSR